MSEKEEKEEEHLLKNLCRDDAELYDALGSYLYLDPAAAISKKNLEILIEEAEKSVEDEDYREARRRYRRAVDKAIFEATQNPGEKSRYIEVIQDLASKTVKVTMKVRDIEEKEGSAAYASSLEGHIKKYQVLSERIEDVIKIASIFYNERLEERGAGERREARREERRRVDSKEQMEMKEAREKREERRKDRKKMGRSERKEAEKKDKEEEKKEKEREEERRREGIEAEREENRMEEGEKERREAKRKEIK
jgi:hypothetical protein